MSQSTTTATSPSNPVVASLPNRSPHPYSSIAMSPSRQYAIIAGKDTLQLVKISPSGLTSCKTIQISQHFRTPSVGSPDQRSSDVGFVQNTFGLGVVTSSNNNRQASSSATRTNNITHTNVVVTSVSWSMPFNKSSKTKKKNSGGSSSGGGGPGGSSDGDSTSTSGGGGGTIGMKATSERGGGEDYTYSSTGTSSSNISDHDDKNTIIAAAGSNGVVVVWNARQIFFSDQDATAGGITTARGSSGRSSTMGNQQPEATLRQHTRAVNSLAWHPRNESLLLTASQDATAKLWERRDMGPRADPEQTHQLRSWFSGAMSSSRSQSDRSYSWFCRATFEPKSEAVRDIKWSKFQDDVFALVTVSGSLIIYNMHVPMRAMAKIAAHTVDATCLDWHPTRPYVIATGGAGDRCVKVWDVENSVNMKKHKKDDNYMVLNAGTGNTVKSEISINSGSSSETDRSMPSSLSIGHSQAVSSIGGTGQAIGSRGFSSLYQGALSSRQKFRTLYVLSISAAVTKLRWRPPCGEMHAAGDGVDEVDRHDSMLAVATARLTSAGGSGILSLWSFHRPFMALGVVEGHEEGAVTDFFWLDTPEVNRKELISANLLQTAAGLAPGTRDSRRLRQGHNAPTSNELADSTRSTGRSEIEAMISEQKEKEKDARVEIWQHVLSVGRDGRCLLQSFVRGDRPISRVPPSCFAMANLSPFQQGYGSLQLFSVYQQVPKGPKSDFFLTGLRQDELTAKAPGVFREIPPVQAGSDSDDVGPETWFGGRRLPSTVPDILFNIVDQGDLNENRLPIEMDKDSLIVGPEVVHLSRFASSYIFYPNERLLTKADVCLHNGNVSEQLSCGSLARMWRAIASMLSGAGLDELPPRGALNQAANVMQFVLLPTIKSVLEERAEAGDVQTCVVICEVLQVVQSDQQVRIPGLDLIRIREWYLAYIDLLHQMCLFSSASFLIRSCNDPYIGALSQQSTTIHESCPRCGKPIQPSADEISSSSRSRRACKNCRKRVGLCFLCHEPVKGMFVWCPGCGHGGHLDHALQWFGGGQKGKAVRELCPTGCGHKCNLSKTLNAFPRTDSMMCLPTSTDLDSISTGTS